MDTPNEVADTSYDVVFQRGWTDTTRHGRMQDYRASEKAVRLPKIVADAAVASGSAVRASDVPAADPAAGVADEDVAGA